MTDRQENKLTMYKAVVNVAGSDTGTTSRVPAFADTLTRFQDLVSRIERTAREATTATAGKTVLKIATEGELIDKTVAVSSALSAFASQQRDVGLYEKAMVQRSTLRDLRDTEFPLHCKAIYELALGYEAELAQYGVSKEDIATLGDSISAFDTALTGQQGSTAIRTGGLKNLVELFGEADRILGEQMDKMVEVMRGYSREFYNRYFASRVIKDIGVRHEPEPPKP